MNRLLKMEGGFHKKYSEIILTDMMKKLGYDKVIEIITMKKEEHKIEHKHIYFDNKRCPYRSVIHLESLVKLVNFARGLEDEKKV